MFLSTVTNNLDAKGRVSVPADFRSTISNDSMRSPFDGIVIWPSLDGNYLGGRRYIPNGGLPSFFGPERSTTILNVQRYNMQYLLHRGSLAFDGGGRVSLPKDMHEFANLNGKVTFVGLGRRFEIWNPELLEERRESILTLARESRHILKTSQFWRC